MGRKLHVEVLSAHNLVGKGSANPYCVIKWNMKDLSPMAKTKTKMKDLSPVWNEAFEFPVDASSMEIGILQIEIYSEGADKHAFLGRVKIHGSCFMKEGKSAIVSHPLEKKSKLRLSPIKGELRLMVWYADEESGIANYGGKAAKTIDYSVSHLQSGKAKDGDKAAKSIIHSVWDYRDYLDPKLVGLILFFILFFALAKM